MSEEYSLKITATIVAKKHELGTILREPLCFYLTYRILLPIRLTFRSWVRRYSITGTLACMSRSNRLQFFLDILDHVQELFENCLINSIKER